MTSQPPENRSTPPWQLRRADQGAVAALVLASLVGIVAWYAVEGGWQGRLIELDEAEPLTVHFQIDINTAPWPELTQLPGIGETLARRIVESRQRQGPFLDHNDLQRVRGIGPKTLDHVRPYLYPIPKHGRAVER